MRDGARRGLTRVPRFVRELRPARERGAPRAVHEEPSRPSRGLRVDDGVSPSEPRRRLRARLPPRHRASEQRASFFSFLDPINPPRQRRARRPRRELAHRAAKQRAHLPGLLRERLPARERRARGRRGERRERLRQKRRLALRRRAPRRRAPPRERGRASASSIAARGARRVRRFDRATPRRIARPGSGSSSSRARKRRTRRLRVCARAPRRARLRFSPRAPPSPDPWARVWASPTVDSATRADACPRAPTRARATAAPRSRGRREERAAGKRRRASPAGRAGAVAVADILFPVDAAAKRLACARDVLGVPLARPRALAGTREDVLMVRRLCAASGGGGSGFVPPSTDASSNSSPSARNSGFPNGTPTVPAGSSSTASGSAVQYTRMAPFSSNPNRVYPPTMRSDLAKLSYTSSISSASTASSGSSFSTCASLNTSARHSRIGTELASAWRASVVGVRHTSSLPERPRSNTARVIFRPTTQTPPRRSSLARRQAETRRPGRDGASAPTSARGTCAERPPASAGSEPHTGTSVPPAGVPLTMRSRPLAC